MDMTNRLEKPRRPTYGASATTQGGYVVRPAALLQALWRRKTMVLLAGLLAALAAGVFALAMPRSYTSSAQLLIDPRGLKVVEKDIAPQAREPDLSVSIIESEMRILGSDLVLRRVIDKLGLAAPSADVARPSALPAIVVTLLEQVGRMRDGLKQMLGRTSTSMSPEQQALVQLQRAIRISRQPNTYVIDVAVTTKDRELSAKIANSLAAQYISARFDGRAAASKKAAEAIDGRLDELRDQVRAADEAVERYKQQHGLASASGRLLTEQRMAELSTQLQSARAETVREQTRFDEVTAARRSRSASGGGLDTLQSPTLERLRSTQAQVRQREASLSATLLPSHPLVRQARQEVRSVERSIDQELGRIADTARTALVRARSTEQALERQLAELKQTAGRDHAALVEMRELERVAEANRTVYQSFLVRARELTEQQRIDPNLAVMLASAVPAREASGPGLVPLVAAAGIAGLGLGAALALRRDFRDPRLSSQLQIGSLFAPEATHVFPIKAARRVGFGGGVGSSPDRALYFLAPVGSATAQASDTLFRAIGGSSHRSGPQLFVVTAGESYQGKSTVALNLAAAAARTGDAVLLVDADRDGRIATGDAEAGEKQGVAEVVKGTISAESAIVTRAEPAVDFMPAGRLGEARMSRACLDRLSETLLAPLDRYDVIVVDAAVAGRDRLTLALAGRADACLLVAQSGSANKASVEAAAGWLESVTGGEVHLVMVSPS
ncbi:MAG: exopolysaccharide transport family protein [Hyphomicrobiaceae bacterium]